MTPEQRKKSNRKYYQKNKEKYFTWNHKYYQENKEKAFAWNHEYYQKNKEKFAEYNRDWQKKNPDKRRASENKYRTSVEAIRKKWFYSNIEALSCPDCGLSFKARPWFAQFHHEVKSQKNKRIYSFAMHGSYNTMVAEFEKGEFLCSNCHVIRHHI